MNALARIDLGAVRANVASLAAHIDSPATAICAVVKADGYGHGAVEVARAALAGGASWLAIATLQEAVELAESGIEAPVLLLSEPDPSDLADFWSSLPAEIRFTVGSFEGLGSIEALASQAVPVHMKIDTGMHRAGVMPDAALALAQRIVASSSVHLEAAWTHFAVADLVTDPFTAEQIERFDRALGDLDEAGISPDFVHLCNSAAAITHVDALRDLVRLGIAIYGVSPSPELEAMIVLRPVLRLSARVSAVRTVDAGETVAYGRLWSASAPTKVATVSIGYADGVRRECAQAGVEVLVGGQRAAILGVVTMDQLMIEATDDVEVGDEVVFIGQQGTDEITANEVGDRLGTIGYEVLTGIGPRVRREYLD